MMLPPPCFTTMSWDFGLVFYLWSLSVYRPGLPPLSSLLTAFIVSVCFSARVVVCQLKRTVEQILSFSVSRVPCQPFSL
ncbi:hypothetical protein AMECASPLE_026556 [Ameca splendens]|uniref:Uncharacterized protein n=1 Tax=Ameca splendens TaxID=208324 RepID=A0ABV0ZE98_9TELE